MKYRALFWFVLGLALLALCACQPPCLRGHDEIRMVPKQCTTVFMRMPMGDSYISIPVGEDCVPEHPATFFVCDQYQSEKFDPVTLK